MDKSSKRTAKNESRESDSLSLHEGEVVKFQFGSKLVTLHMTNYDEIDADELTTIHYHNMMGELLTCSVALNRIGNLLGEANDILRRAKLDFDLFEAQMSESKYKDLTFLAADAKGNEKPKYPTGPQVEAAVKRTPAYKVKRMNLIEAEKNVDIFNSLYWAIKSKDDKLNKLTDKLTPDDMSKQIVEGVVNGILIKTDKAAII